MSSYRFEQIRNIVLVGHGAVGKTSLADLFLFKAGIGSRAGSVDEGTSQLDFDDEARQRHFSISSAMVHFAHKGVRVNVIDTPGYPDFVGQAISALCAAETAISVISATAGVEANTRRTFDLAGKAQLARMIVINKLDQENIDFTGLVQQIQESFGRNCVPMNVPTATGVDFRGVIGTLEASKMEAATAAGQAVEYGSAVMDAIIEADEELMERYLDGQELSSDEVLAGATKAIATGGLIPIFCVSARTGAGIPELMDAIVDFALSPGELVRHATRDTGEEIEVATDEEAPLIAQVFKTRIDPFVSKMSFIRIFSGRLTKDSTVRDVRTGRGVKIHQLLDVQGGNVEAVDEAHAGDVIAVAKIDDFQVGDTLVSNGETLELPHLKFPMPMIGLAVEPRSRSDQQKISGALHKIEEEDPTFHVIRDGQTHEMVMQGMSELHLQVVQERLHRREKVDVVTHAPRIPYRETILESAEGSYRHKKQTGGSGQFAEVHLRVYPLEQGLDPDTYFTRERFPGLREFHYDPAINFAYLDCVSGGSVPNQFIPAVEKGVREEMELGILAGCPMQDVAVALFFGKDHPVDSNEAAFRTAGAHCFRETALQAKPALLEPIVHLEVTVPADKLGDVTSDLNTRRGRMEGLDLLPGGQQVIRARAPQAEVMTYARHLSGLTGGQGSYTMELSHYELMPPNEQIKVVQTSSNGRHNGS
ncbi:elongation factor G [Planctellipticum variicoloris]|uniref:elongation factor G n=1 Tax=Planctellipticum variicoloris TaxID=3064265 RepID=UPI003013E104|nr:elongation factor G [Planctomycetaceae bacterium SH412]